MGQLEAFLPFVEPEHVQALVRKDELGPLSFDRIVTPLASIRSLLEDAIPQEEEIPAAQLNAAVQQLNGIQEIERQIETFTVGEQNPSGTRDSLVQQIVSLRDNVVTQLRPVLRSDASTVATQMAETRKALEEATATRDSLAELLSQARQGKVEAAGQEAYQFFEDEAKAHDISSATFLKYTVGLSIALAVIALVELAAVVIWPPDYKSFGDAAAASLPKITLLILVSFGVGFAARNYRVNRHLSVLNRTKAITIRAAEKYAAGVDEPSHRDLVVASLVQAVFAIGDTGYLPVDSERTIIETPGAAGLLAASAPKG